MEQSINQLIKAGFGEVLGEKLFKLNPEAIKRDYIKLWRGIFKTLKYIQKVTSLNSVGILACHTV